MSETDSIDVLFCANPVYFQHLAVAAVSLAESNRHNRLNVHVVTCEHDEIQEQMLHETMRNFSNVELRLYFAEEALIGEFFVDRYLSKETYLRLIAPELLPTSVKKLIYLDCDLVVVDDIRPLWDVDLGENVIAAAPDYPWPGIISLDKRDALGIPRDAIYVNAGVLVIDIEKWRRGGMTRIFISYIQEKSSRLTFHDQDAINALLHDHILLLDPRWNLQARMYRVRKTMPQEYAATSDARRDPAIIHYAGPEKPWRFRSLSPAQGVYFRHLDRTAWSGENAGLRSWFQRFEYHSGVFLSKNFNLNYFDVLLKTRRIPAKLKSLSVRVIALMKISRLRLRRP